jgi:hypothetical protein
MAEMLVEDGKPYPARTAGDYMPELKDMIWAKATLRHLFNMEVQTSPNFPLRIWPAKQTLCRGTNMLPRTRYRPCRSKRQNIDGNHVGKSLFKRQQNS